MNKFIKPNYIGIVATHYNTYSNIIKLIGFDDEIEAKEGDVIEYRVKKYDDGVKEIYKIDILIWNGKCWNLVDYYHEEKMKDDDELGMNVYCVMSGETRTDLDHVVYASTSKADAEKFAYKNEFYDYSGNPCIKVLNAHVVESVESEG